MPDSPALVDAGKALLEVFQSLQPSASALKLDHFVHGGVPVRGLATTRDIHAGNEAIVVPNHLLLNADTMVERRFRHIFDMADSPMDRNAMALWLAEKKATLVNHPDHKLTPTEQYWASVLRSMPTLEEYRDLGVPLAAPADDLNQLYSFSRFEDIPGWAHHVQKNLRIALESFNADPTAQTKVKYDDALWGRIAASTRTFNCRSATMAPIADMINHSGDEDNVKFGCDLDTGALKMIATKDLKAGDEMKLAYHTKGPAETMVQFYGIYEGSGGDERWSAAECERLQAAHFGNSGGAMLKTIGKLVDEHCAPPGKGDSAEPPVNPRSELQTNAAEAAVNPLVAWLIPQSCLSISRKGQRAINSGCTTSNFL